MKSVLLTRVKPVIVLLHHGIAWFDTVIFFIIIDTMLFFKEKICDILLEI